MKVKVRVFVLDCSGFRLRQSGSEVSFGPVIQGNFSPAQVFMDHAVEGIAVGKMWEKELEMPCPPQDNWHLVFYPMQPYKFDEVAFQVADILFYENQTLIAGCAEIVYHDGVDTDRDPCAELELCGFCMTEKVEVGVDDVPSRLVDEVFETLRRAQ